MGYDADEYILCRVSTVPWANGARRHGLEEMSLRGAPFGGGDTVPLCGCIIARREVKAARCELATQSGSGGQSLDAMLVVRDKGGGRATWTRICRPGLPSMGRRSIKMRLSRVAAKVWPVSVPAGDRTGAGSLLGTEDGPWLVAGTR